MLHTINNQLKHTNTFDNTFHINDNTFYKERNIIFLFWRIECKSDPHFLNPRYTLKVAAGCNVMTPNIRWARDSVCFTLPLFNVLLKRSSVLNSRFAIDAINLRKKAVVLVQAILFIFIVVSHVCFAWREFMSVWWSIEIEVGLKDLNDYIIT